jgi:lipoprotein-releasing system permease protein
LSFPAFIALRYFQTHRRNRFLSFITAIAVLGVALGTAALVITLSILDGFENDIRSKVVSFTSHIEIQGFQSQPLPDYRSTSARIRIEYPGIDRLVPYAAREGMIRSSGGVDGVFLKGIDLSAAGTVAGQRLVAGRFLQLSDTGAHSIVLGRKLGDRLNIGPGSHVAVFALPREAVPMAVQPRAMQFIVAGLYESGMAEFDDVYAYTDLASAQQLFQIVPNVSGYDITLRNIADADSIAGKLQNELGYPHYVRTVFQLYRNLFSWVELQKKLSPILLSLIIIVATVNIIGTLLMFVLEKIHAIAVLTSLGAGPGQIRKIFTLQGLLIGFVGVVAGDILGFILCWIQKTWHLISIPSDVYYMDTVPILLRWENFGIVTVVALALCLLTTIIPARAASKITPISAFRFGR